MHKVNLISSFTKQFYVKLNILVFARKSRKIAFHLQYHNKLRIMFLRNCIVDGGKLKMRANWIELLKDQGIEKGSKLNCVP